MKNASPGPRHYIETVFPRYGDSCVKDKTVETVLSYHGDPYTDKTTYLY